jgi:hypothetical protein
LLPFTESMWGECECDESDGLELPSGVLSLEVFSVARSMKDGMARIGVSGTPG